jgi:ribosomal-protein-alanine N-acetyltransferase
LAYGFETLELERIVGRASIHNGASIRVLSKVGMRFEKNIEIEGHPSVQYVLARSEWLAAR